MSELRIIYEYGVPDGIGDKNGFLLFFPKVTNFPGQEDRYKKDLEKQRRLADLLLAALKFAEAIPVKEPEEQSGAPT